MTAWQRVKLKTPYFLLIRNYWKSLILLFRVAAVLLESKRQIKSIFPEFWIYNIHPIRHYQQKRRYAVPFPAVKPKKQQRTRI